jgi:glutaredoxin
MTTPSSRFRSLVWLLAVGLTAAPLSTASPVPASLEAMSASAPAATPPPDIELFVRSGCPHCAAAESFLTALGKERPHLRMVVRDVGADAAALDRLKEIAGARRAPALRVPAMLVGGQLLVGFSPEAHTEALVLDALAQRLQQAGAANDGGAGSCAAEQSLSCDAGPAATAPGEPHFELDFLGRSLTPEAVGLPLFTLAIGLLDGLNPCSMWVLILMISLLAPLNDRRRMLAIAGTFVLVEGIAYYAFMAAWLNLFLFIGLSRASEIVLAGIAIVAGAINLKDFWALGWGVSLSIPDTAKPGIYARMRDILHARNLAAALAATVLLAVLVQFVELLCTSGFPALYTRILTQNDLHGASYYGYLLLYNAAYMLDDVIVLGIGVVTLSRHRLQEKEGRWLKLVSGVAMIGLGVYLLV